MVQLLFATLIWNLASSFIKEQRFYHCPLVMQSLFLQISNVCHNHPGRVLGLAELVRMKLRSSFKIHLTLTADIPVEQSVLGFDHPADILRSYNCHLPSPLLSRDIPCGLGRLWPPTKSVYRLVIIVMLLHGERLLLPNPNHGYNLKCQIFPT